MKKWRLKGCPKCGGDQILNVNEVMFWRFPAYHCLQCGFDDVIKKLAWSSSVKRGQPRNSNGVSIR